MRILVYKRTHTGDPDRSGCFGVYCCMGQVRARSFDAVIGIGGVSRAPVLHGIDRRITWIGIAPHQVDVAGDGYPVVDFEHFYLKDQQGHPLSDKAPNLAKRLFAKNAPRVVMLDADDELKCVLKLARHAQPSPALLGQSPKQMSCTRARERNG